MLHWLHANLISGHRANDVALKEVLPGSQSYWIDASRGRGSYKERHGHWVSKLHHRGPRVIKIADLIYRKKPATVHFKEKSLNRMTLTGVQIHGHIQNIQHKFRLRACWLRLRDILHSLNLYGPVTFIPKAKGADSSENIVTAYTTRCHKPDDQNLIVAVETTNLI
jgi:hypothetical protein